ncbi:MAG: 3-deoxy-manno-octulosonate cytidylyltransferase [Boseongicola sp.]
MRAIIFIPARYASSRFSGKPLAMLAGATGESKSLIQRSWEAAEAAKGIAERYILTDSQKIADAVREFGGHVLMTSATCRNGTERCAEAAAMLETPPELIINLQGDAPLTPPHYIEALLAEFEKDPSVRIATPVLRTDTSHLAKLQNDRAEGRVGATTAVFDTNCDALYFSKEILPYYDNAPPDAVPVYHHIGCYAYRPEDLSKYSSLPEGRLEMREGLEQLRFLENGTKIRCVIVNADGREFWELNNPTDISVIEAILAKEGRP